MSFGFGFGLPSWQTLSGGFSPASLFSAGENGAWYDPSDLTTLFDDSAGTTPVSAPGNGADVWVGLMLDKSKGLVLGSELVTNGGPGFTATTGWAASSATVTASGGKLVCEKTGSGAAVYWTLATAIGTWYQVNISWENVNATSPSILVNSTGGLSITTSNTTATIYFLAVATSTFVQMQLGSGAVGTGTRIISLSTKTIPGNHATQTASAKRPKLAARYNLLEYTEQINNGYWLKFQITVSANAGTAPDGTTTADLLYPTSTGVLRTIYRGGFASISKTHSVAAKASGKNWFCIYDETTSAGAAWFNLSTGTVGTVKAGFANATITFLGNGWYRCSVTSTSSFSQYTAFAPVDADNSTTLTVNGTDGVLVWGADLRPTSQATGLIGPTYQRVVDAATYDAVGFLPYLEFNGLSWSMSTGSIDPGAVDKAQVFAGVRKLSDAAQGAVAEFSATIASNNGTFLLAAPDGATQTYGFDSKGTTQVDAVASSLAAPRTNVVTGLADIAGDSCVIRINGAVADTETGDQGTGNFLTYPLFIGGRNNASVFFSGWLSSLIVRFGANLSQGQIEATESWVNQKTGAF